jgi:hypothetical protein
MGFGTLAAINAFTLILLVYLIFRGEDQEKQGVPKEHQDL